VSANIHLYPFTPIQPPWREPKAYETAIDTAIDCSRIRNNRRATPRSVGGDKSGDSRTKRAAPILRLSAKACLAFLCSFSRAQPLETRVNGVMRVRAGHRENVQQFIVSAQDHWRGQRVQMPVSTATKLKLATANTHSFAKGGLVEKSERHVPERVIPRTTNTESHGKCDTARRVAVKFVCIPMM
jgi:hypothetical protein